LEGKSFSIIIASLRMKRPSIRGEDFLNSHGTKKTSERKGLEKLGGEEFLVVFSCVIFSWKGKERDEEYW
jgi:hypothetical protein